MANRSWLPILGSLEVDVVSIFGHFTVGAVGAPTLVTSGSKGVFSVVRNSAGNYTIQMTDNYNLFLGAALTLLHAPEGSNADGTHLRLTATNVSSSTVPSVTLQAVNTSATAAADPASGAEIFFRIDLRNSSVS